MKQCPTQGMNMDDSEYFIIFMMISLKKRKQEYLGISCLKINIVGALYMRKKTTKFGILLFSGKGAFQSKGNSLLTLDRERG